MKKVFILFLLLSSCSYDIPIHEKSRETEKVNIILDVDTTKNYYYFNAEIKS